MWSWTLPFKCSPRGARSRGNVMLIALMALLVAMIFMPLLVKMFQKESKDAVRSHFSRQAFNLVDAALAKFEWRMMNDLSLGPQLLQGPVPAGYRNDIVYDDIPGGVYKIDVSSTPLTRDTLVATIRAKETKSQLVKTLKATYYIWVIETGAGTLSWINNSNPAVLHWSPWIDDRLVLSNNFNIGYPRKISGNEIAGIDTDPAEPNSGPDWESYRTTELKRQVNFWESPALDYEYYRLKAVASAVPPLSAGGLPIRMYSTKSIAELPTGPVAISSPSGSGYFPGIPNRWTDSTHAQIMFPVNYQFISSTSVIYLAGHDVGEGTVRFSSGTFLDIEAVITPLGSVHLDGPGSGVVGATIPANAHLEYASAAGNAVWTAGGGSSMASVFSSAGRCCYILNNVNIRGMVEAVSQSNYTTYGPGTIAGVVVRGAGANNDRLEVYYQEDIAARAQVRAAPKRISLIRESDTSW